MSPVGNGGARPNGRQEQGAPFLRKAGLYIGVALEVPATIIGGSLLGYLLDRYLGTQPWLTVFAALIAFVGACFRVVQWVRFFSKDRS